MKREELDISTIARCHPSVLVESEGVRTTISLEWFEEYAEHVDLLGFTLICFDKEGRKKEIFFERYEDMIATLENIFHQLQQIKK